MSAFSTLKIIYIHKNAIFSNSKVFTFLFKNFMNLITKTNIGTSENPDNAPRLHDHMTIPVSKKIFKKAHSGAE